MADKYDDLYAVVPAQLTPPWNGMAYEPDYQLLHALIDVTVRSGDAFDPQTGALAAATNVWVATELRRAGIDPDRVWPRAVAPRNLPWDAAAAARKIRLRNRLPASWGVTSTLNTQDLLSIQQRTIESMLAEIGKGPAVPGTAANMQGAHFPKEIDVSMARYDRGLELGVSTKTMIREPTKNIPNRREEASGDLLNIRRRFPLSAFGYLFLLEYSIYNNVSHFGKIVDMCRKVTLAPPGDMATAYDASCLLVVELQVSPPKTVVHQTAPPEDVRADRVLCPNDRLLAHQIAGRGSLRRPTALAGRGTRAIALCPHPSAG